MEVYLVDTGFNQIIKMIEKHKNNAYRKVNEEMILLYLEIGKFLYDLRRKVIMETKLQRKHLFL